MKEIIYLDTDLLHSYIAQMHEGLPGELTSERSQDILESTSNNTTGKNVVGSGIDVKTGKVSVPLLFDSPEGTVKVKLDVEKAWSEGTNLTQTESGKEIISKRLHDNALGDFIKHLEENQQIKSFDESKENDYIMYSTSFQVFDNNYLKAIIDPTYLLPFIQREIKTGIEEIRYQETEKMKTLTKTEKQIAQRHLNEQLDPLTKALDDQKEEFNFVYQALEYLERLLPTNTFAKFDNAISYLSKDYLREDPKVLMYKHPKKNPENKVTVIGKRVRFINSTDDMDIGTDLLNISQVIDTVMVSLGLVKNQDILIAPVAIYYE